MSRILSAAAAAVITIACATAAMAQQSSYPDRYSTSNDRYSTSDRSTPKPTSERQAWPAALRNAERQSGRDERSHPW